MFNLIHEPWLRVENPDGSLGQDSLKGVLLNAHRYARLAHPSPAVLPALHRFLLAVLYRVLDEPRSTDEGVDLFKQGRFPAERVGAYLEHWQDRFDLFHPERPFYQVPDSEDKVSGVARLAAELASGTNKLLFDHTAEADPPELTHAEIAQLLVTRQMTAIPEGAGYSPSPAGGAAFVLPQGRNLFETLVLNLVPYSEEENEDDAPIWEGATPKSAAVKAAKPRGSRGLTERYTWLTRIVKLQEPEGDAPVSALHYAAGIKFDGGDSPDPMLAYRKDEKRGLLPVSFNKYKAFWRDFQALIPNPDSGSYLAPQTVKHARNIYEELERTDPLTLLVSGLSNDKAKVVLWRTEQFNVPQVLLQNPGAYAELTRLLEYADNGGRTLYGATQRLAEKLLSIGERKPDPADVRNLAASFPASMHYWSRLETRFPELLERFETQTFDERFSWWLGQITLVTREAWELALKSAGENERAWRAGAEASKVINTHLKRLREQTAEPAP